MKRIAEMLTEGRKKTDFTETIEALGSKLEKWLEDINYSPDKIKHIDIDPEPIEDLELKLKEITDNPKKCIMEGIQRYSSIVTNFLKIYHFGYLRELSLEKNGLFYCEIPILIHPSTCSLTPASEKEFFQKQMNKLRESGIVLTKAENELEDIAIEATTENISGIKALLAKINAKWIKFDLETRKDMTIIDRIKFYVKPESLDEFSEDCDKPVEVHTEILNEDEIVRIKKCLSEISHAVSVSDTYQQSDLRNLTGEVVRSCFREMCNLLNIETKISKEVDAEVTTKREETLQKQKIREQIASGLSAEVISAAVKSYAEIIEEWSESSFYYSLEELKIGPYGAALTFKYMTYRIQDKKVRKIYECPKNSVSDKYIRVPLATDENINQIKSFILDRFPDARFEEVNIRSKYEDYTDNYFNYIESVTIMINKL